MKSEKYKQCVIIVAIGVVSLVVFAVISGYFALSIVAVIGGMVVLSFCKTRMSEVIIDERSYKIAEQASRRTLQVFAIISGVIGILLVLISQYGYPEVKQVGITLAYSACTLLLLYSLFYRYYTKKFGE